MLPINDTDRKEWARCAKAMHARGRGAVGDRMAFAATCGSLPIAEFDAISSIYRNWLCYDEPKAP